MTYYRWMIRNYTNEVSLAGDLARDMKTDAAFPRKEGRNGILDYLFRHRADRSCIRAFDETWRIYAGERRRMRRRPYAGRRRIMRYVVH